MRDWRRARVLTLVFVAVMDRDRRLTGFLRGQTDNVKAPPGFELSNPWRVRLDYSAKRLLLLQARENVERQLTSAL